MGGLGLIADVKFSLVSKYGISVGIKEPAFAATCISDSRQKKKTGVR